MRVYVMTDMEGACGVVNFDDWCTPESRNYMLGCRFLTEEVNAAVEGFLLGGASSITVVDGHGHGAIDLGTLDTRVEYVRGPTPGPYPFFLDNGYDVMAWIGQHAMGGAPGGHLPHTGDFDVDSYAINEVPVGEFAQIAMCGALYDAVPVFGAGDAAFVAEANALVPEFIGVTVKHGLNQASGKGVDTERARLGWAGALHRPRGTVLDEIRDGASHSLREFGSHRSPLPLPDVWKRTIVLRPGSAGELTTTTTYPDLLSLLNDRSEADPTKGK